MSFGTALQLVRSRLRTGPRGLAQRPASRLPASTIRRVRFRLTAGSSILAQHIAQSSMSFDPSLKWRLGSLNVLVPETSAAIFASVEQYRGDERRLAFGVGVAVVAKALGQLALQRGVLRGELGMRAERVAQREVRLQRRGAGGAHIQMMPRQIGRRAERLAADDAEVAEPRVAERRQPARDLVEVFRVADDDDDVDDRLRVQPWRGRAAGVLDVESELLDRGGDAVAQALERRRPSRVVRHDDDRLGPLVGRHAVYARVLHRTFLMRLAASQCRSGATRKSAGRGIAPFEMSCTLINGFRSFRTTFCDIDPV